MEASITQVLPSKEYALQIDIELADDSIMSEFDIGLMQHLISRGLQELFLPQNEFLYVVKLVVFAELSRNDFFREALAVVVRTLLKSDIEMYDIPVIEEDGGVMVVKGESSGEMLMACTL